MDVDQVGDIYIGGVVDRGRIDVDPGPAVEQVVASEDVPGLWGKRPVFIVRLSPEMDMRWVDTCWGYVDIEVPVGLVDIDVTESGMVIATGYYYRLEWMDSQSSDFISILAYGVATFVRKLKTIGEHVWTVGQQARELDHNDIQPMQLAVARSGDVFVVGSGLQGYADVDLDPGPKEEWRSMTGPFVWHLDADGEYQGALDGFQYSSHIASHIFGGLLVGSSFKGEFDIDPGPGIDIRHSIDDSIDSYALLLDTEYNILWPWVSGIPGDDKITAMASDDQGRIYLAVSLEEGSLLVALGPEGNELWRRDFPGLVNDMVASNKNGLYLFGGFSKEGDFDPGPGEDIRSPTVPVDTFVTRLSLSGTY